MLLEGLKMLLCIMLGYGLRIQTWKVTDSKAVDGRLIISLLGL